MPQLHAVCDNITDIYTYMKLFSRELGERILHEYPALQRFEDPVSPRIRQLLRRPFPAQATYGRRLVRLGAQLCAADGTVINRDFARAWLPGPLGPGAKAEVQIDIAAPSTPGRYALKFDLVSEGIDWFERCGSRTTTKTLWVR